MASESMILSRQIQKLAESSFNIGDHGAALTHLAQTPYSTLSLRPDFLRWAVVYIQASVESGTVSGSAGSIVGALLRHGTACHVSSMLDVPLDILGAWALLLFDKNLLNKMHKLLRDCATEWIYEELLAQRQGNSCSSTQQQQQMTESVQAGMGSTSQPISTDTYPIRWMMDGVQRAGFGRLLAVKCMCEGFQQYDAADAWVNSMEGRMVISDERVRAEVRREIESARNATTALHTVPAQHSAPPQQWVARRFAELGGMYLPAAVDNADVLVRLMPRIPQAAQQHTSAARDASVPGTAAPGTAAQQQAPAESTLLPTPVVRNHVASLSPHASTLDHTTAGLLLPTAPPSRTNDGTAPITGEDLQRAQLQPRADADAPEVAKHGSNVPLPGQPSSGGWWSWIVTVKVVAAVLVAGTVMHTIRIQRARAAAKKQTSAAVKEVSIMAHSTP